MLFLPLLCAALGLLALACGALPSRRRGLLALAAALLALFVGAGLLATGYVLALVAGGARVALLLALAVVLGFAAGRLLRQRRGGWALLLLLPFAWPFWQVHGARDAKPAVEAAARDFVASEPRIAALAGAPVQPVLAVPAAEDDPRERMEFAVGPYFVLVDVLREAGGPQYRIACVTTRAAAQRDPDVEACLQSPVRLPNAVS